MSRKKLAWANKEVETFVCILGEEDVVYDVYVDAAAIDIRPTTKVTAGHDDRKSLALKRGASAAVGHAVSQGVNAAGLRAVSEPRDGPGGAHLTQTP
ncbi:unnamed protein product [Boreogadus saida]